MADIATTLQKIGLSSKAAQIYMALLELAEGSVIEVAQKAGLHRTTVYNILPELLRSGLVQSTLKEKRRIYFVDDVRRLRLDAEERLKAVDDLVPQLKAIQNILPFKPKISFYEGMGGMKELYQDTLDSVPTGGAIQSFTGLADFYSVMPREFYEWYVRERVKKKIHISIIAPDSPAAREWKRDSVKHLRQIKLIPAAHFQFKGDMEIYSNKLALLSYPENFMGVIIESKEIHDMQKAAFELMWNSLK